MSTPRTIVLSGAGLSADSGVPTFWGPGGVYERHFYGMTPEEFLNGGRLRTHWAEIHAFHDDLRTLVARAEPNAAHVALAELARANPKSVVLLTQNIDDLLERAGAPPETVVHLHGTLNTLRCLGRNHQVLVPASGRDPDARCPQCLSRLRPGTVLFGEQAPEYARLYREVRRMGLRDHWMVVGTQGAILPVDELTRTVPGRRSLNLREASPHITDSLFHTVRYEGAVTAVPALLAEAREWVERGIVDLCLPTPSNGPSRTR